MPKIDGPLEAISQQYENKRDRIFAKIWAVARELEPFGILSALKVLFSEDATNARFEAFIRQLVLEVNRLEDTDRFFSEKVESAEFKETIMAAMNETARTIDLEKIKRFALIVGSSLDSKRNTKSWDDAAVYIRDISQLGDGDIKALSVLYTVQRDLFVGKNVALDPNSYTEKNSEVLELVHKSGMPRDEFYSRCARLNGFGLAIEVQRNESRVSPGNLCFRLTTRGRDLISIICG